MRCNSSRGVINYAVQLQSRSHQLCGATPVEESSIMWCNSRRGVINYVVQLPSRSHQLCGATPVEESSIQCCSVTTKIILKMLTLMIIMQL